MKISYLLDCLGKTGGYIVLYNFMDNLVKRGYKVDAVLPNETIKWKVGLWEKKIESTKNENFLRSSFRNIVSPVLNHKSMINIKLLYNLKNFTEGLVENWKDSDVTISTINTTAYAGYYLSNKTTPLYHMQHFEEIFYQDIRERIIARNTYNLPLIKISNSKWLQNIILKYFNSPSFILNPGIDLNIFKEYINTGEKYHHKKTWTIVSFFDEERKWKGFEDAVQAVKLARKHLKKSNIELKWKVFGLNPPLKNYETEFEYVGRIFGEDLAKLYSEADIVLLTSWYESFPLPPIEAMACGSLVITTKYGTEDYVSNKMNGLVSLPRKIEEIANKIIYAIENPHESHSMVQNGLNTVKEFNWEKRTDILEEILNESINNYQFDQFRLFDDLVKGNFKQYMYDIF